MEINKSHLRQILAYLSIILVTIISIFVYATNNWKYGIIAVGGGIVVLVLFFVLSLGDDDEY